MIYLLKRDTFRKDMEYKNISADMFTSLVNDPLIIPCKQYTPLWIFGKMSSEVSIDQFTRNPRCAAENIDSLYCLQLDYDSGMTIMEFRERFSEYSYALYTTYSYGFKAGDRFRVILPLADKLPVKYLGTPDIKQELIDYFDGVDVSCFDRGHWQCMPAIREKGAPYYSYINKGKRWGTDNWSQYDDQYASHEQVMAEYRMQLARKRQAIQDAAENFLVVPPCNNFDALLRIAQERIDDTTEGSRDTTLYKTLNYLHDQGVDASDALTLDVWEGFQSVLEDKVSRIWFG